MKSVRIDGVPVGPGHPPYIIAEIGSNHNGDMNLCRRLIDSAAESGAQAVKFQSWTDKSLIAEEEYARNISYSDKKKHFGSLREMVTPASTDDPRTTVRGLRRKDKDRPIDPTSGKNLRPLEMSPIRFGALQADGRQPFTS